MVEYAITICNWLVEVEKLFDLLHRANLYGFYVFNDKNLLEILDINPSLNKDIG